MTSSDANIVATWNAISTGINRYFSIFIFLFGTTGNILNILVLSQRTLRTNSCSLSFLGSSIANLIAILSGLTTRALSGWALDLTNTNDYLCKLRGFILFVSRNVASWLILLAAIDRWLLSSLNVRRRHMSSIKNTRRGIIIIIILSFVIYIPMIECFQANLTNAPLKCYGKTEICRLSHDLTYACITILFPIMLMCIFGIITIINIHRLKSRIHIINNIEMNVHGRRSSSIEQQRRILKKKFERRLLLMLLIQISLLTLLTLPQALQKIYSTVTTNQIQSPIRIAIDNFLFNLVILMTYAASGMSFYIYTLSGGNVFRNVLKDLIKKFGLKTFTFI